MLIMQYYYIGGLYVDHPWIKEDGEAPDTPLDNAVLDRLKQFRAMNKFKKVALRVIKNLSKERISKSLINYQCLINVIFFCCPFLSGLNRLLQVAYQRKK